MDPADTAVSSLLAAFPRERTWLLPALHAVQRACGSVEPGALAAVAAHLRVPLSEAWGVATHYPEVRLVRPGRRLVRVCAGVSCRVSGAVAVREACERALGVRAGETAADGGVTLEEMDCAFACAMAPVVEVAHRFVGRVTPARVDALLAHPPPPAALDGRVTAPVRPYEEMRRAAGAGTSARPRIVVGLGTCGAAVGAAATYAALAREAARARLAFDVIAGGCNGMCWAAPAVDVVTPESRRTFASVSAEAAAAFVDALARGAEPQGAVDASVLAMQRRVLLERCGVVDPGDIADAVRHGAYAAFARALAEGRPERVIDEVRAAGLQGRGGAYFPTAAKWEACRAAAGAPKFVVLNGEEGEPGIFKDRHVMEGDPHAVLEGVLLAAFAAGASQAILYVHGEADLAAARLTVAAAQARAAGLLGPRILGSELSLEVEMRRGLGGFVLGEETALLESIEGRRAMPRTRPPFPVEAGLWGKPTVINNVETLAAVPRIVERGGRWFASLGGGFGTKLFGLSGHVRRPGVVEMELGHTLADLIDGAGGGSATGRPIRAAVVGGPSGSIVPAQRFSVPLVPRGEVNPGTGGVIALDDTVAVRDVVRTLLAFNTRESCGKCTPCREGTARLLAMLDGGVKPPEARALSEVIQLASLCGLGQAAPYAVLSGLAAFPEEFHGPRHA